MVWVTNKALDYPRSSSSRNKWLNVAACWGLQISLCQVYRSVYVKCLFTKAKQKSQSRQTKSVGNTLSQASLGSTYNRRKKMPQRVLHKKLPWGSQTYRPYCISGQKGWKPPGHCASACWSSRLQLTSALKGVEDVAVHVWTGWGFLQILHPSHSGAFPDP